MRDEESIFAEAVAIEAPGERAAFLDRCCGLDAQLRERLDALLLAYRCAGAFLESQPPGMGGADVDVGQVAIPAAAGESWVGTFRVLHEIGEGGMGVVYLAEQDRPLRRRVALKIIKPGMDTRQVIARFEAERQTLAMMDHPNIAKVFDAGSTPSGRPYFAMELVDGPPITRYCEEHKLGTAQRLEMFALLCNAVQHAHQKGVIHRDLKPSNILVAVADGQPVPKIIDFGIAKALTPAADRRTRLTGGSQFLGTPMYMSPEQVDPAAARDVDTRSDVYSLGVLLYELLTGATPFDRGRLGAAPPEEVRRIIREEEPRRPSVRLGALPADELQAVAANQRTDAARLRRTMRGDLDWIVLRAMEKDRSRRYPTAHALAADVRRYLGGDPVFARPPSARYRLGKVARKHRVALATAAAVFAALLVGGVATTVAMVQAIRARADATVKQRLVDEKQREAHRVARDALAVGDYLQSVISDANPWGAAWHGRAPRKMTTRAMLDAASARLDAGALAGQKDVQAAVRAAVAAAYQGLGAHPEAEVQWRAAIRLQQEVYGGRDHPQLAKSMTALAVLLTMRGRVRDLPEAERLAAEGVRMRRAVSPDSRAEMADSLDAHARVLRVKGQYDAAEARAREALALRQVLLAIDAAARRDLSRTQCDLALTLARKGDDAGAMQLLLEALAADQELLPKDHPQIATDLYDLAALLERNGEIDRAIEHAGAALQIRRKHLAEEQGDVSDAVERLWLLLCQEGRFGEAEALLLERHERLRALASVHPTRLFEMSGQFVNLYDVWGDPEKLRPWLARVEGAMRRDIDVKTERIQSLGPSAPPADRSKQYSERGAFLARAGRFDEAMDDLSEALRIQPGAFDPRLFRAAVRAYVGDADGHREDCAELLGRFGDSTLKPPLEGTLLACLMLPGAGGDPRRLESLAVRLEACRGPNQALWPRTQMLKALAEFRCGNFRTALESLPATRPMDNPPERATVELIRALARDALGHRAEASAALGRANDTIRRRVPKPGVGDLRPWGLESWLLCQVIRREAEAKLQAQSTSPR